MATTTQDSNPNIWNIMNYVPPRGPCNQKDGLLSAKCTCQRFMIHPVKAATSYECDGCGHHASYHSMENKAEEEILKRWNTEATLRESNVLSASAPRPKKRPRAIQSAQVMELDSDGDATTAVRQARSTRRAAADR